MTSKLYEGHEHHKVAEKYLKTSLVRWKADYDSAADEFSQAAQCFRIARNLKKAKECYLRAADCHKKNKALFHAAKCLESAMIVSKETAHPDELYALACEAASLYQQYGSGDCGACVLDKAGKILQDSHPTNAVKLFQQAADVSAATCTEHQGADYTSKASRILIRMKRYEEALDSLRREIGFHKEARNFGAVGRLTMAAVLVHLALGDNIAAEKAYKEWGSNCEAPEAATIEQLLKAYDEDDPRAAKQALESPFIRNMDVEYARLATSVPLPEDWTARSRASAAARAAAANAGQAAHYSGAAAAAATTAAAAAVTAAAAAAAASHQASGSGAAGGSGASARLSQAASSIQPGGSAGGSGASARVSSDDDEGTLC